MMAELSRERWQVVSPYLDRALDLGDTERTAWLAALRAENPTLASDIQILLEEHETLRKKQFLERPPMTVPGEPSLEGRTIGAYTLVSPIGQGGMGTVWLARRSDGRYERRVAVKFPHLALRGGGGDRFKREGAFLGRLSHPHIADLIDAGIAADGQPYLVLEHVDGEPLDRHCDQRGLGVEARIRLFLDVLSAVAHAHASLIVHRDLKPSNVLVSTEGEVKLLDFGIAKLLSGDAEGGTAEPVTRDGVAMTPEYAAPEQITGGVITTATDVYALGVLLYSLLTGEHPAGPGPHSPAQLTRAIVDTAPPRPSEVVVSRRTEQITAADRASRRSTTPERLRRTLRGDLDTIVAKALKKVPKERYVSVTALADDLRRYLEHKPINARPDTFAYRTGKAVRRNRTAVALASLSVAATVAGVVGTLVEARTARVQRDFALRQWSRAEAINQLNDFLVGESPPYPGETLDLAERIFGLQQGRDPADRVETLIQLSNRSGLEEGTARARRMAQEAYEVSRGMTDPSLRARAACTLGNVLAIDAASFDTSVLAHAEALIREGLGELPEESRFAFDRAYCLMDGFYVSKIEHAFGEATARLQLAQQVLEHAPPHSEEFDLKVSQGLADALRLQGRNREASAEYARLSARLTALGRDKTALAGMTYYKWGLSVHQLGRPVEAEKLIHRAIVQFSETEDDPDAISWQLISHARAVRDLGQLAQAAAQAEHAQGLAQRNGEQLFVNQAQLLRASIYRLRGDLARAQEMLADVEPRMRQNLPAGHIAFASLLSEQALLAQARGDVSTGLTLIDQGMTIAEASVKASQQGAELLPTFLTYRSDMLRQLGRTDDAVADASRALSQIQEAIEPGKPSSTLGYAHLALGRALQAQEKHDEASTAFRSAAENLQNTLGPDHPDARTARQLAE